MNEKGVGRRRVASRPDPGWQGEGLEESEG